MKKNGKIAIRLIALLIIAVILSFSSCNNETADATPDYIDWSKYSIVLPSSDEYSWMLQLEDFKSQYTSIVGRSPKIRYQNEDDEENDYEIIFPGCKETVELGQSYNSSDYSIIFKEKKIYIVTKGCSTYDSAAIQAIRRFTMSVLKRNAEYKAGDCIEYIYQYRFSDLTLNGKDISEYVLVYEEQELNELGSLANDVINLIGRCYAAKLTEITASAYSPEKYPCAILFGECGGLSEGISKDIGLRECKVRCNETTVAVYPSGGSLLSLLEAINSIIAPQVADVEYGDSGNLVIEEGDFSYKYDLSDYNELNGNTKIIVSGEDDFNYLIDLQYESYKDNLHWLVAEYPDIVFLTEKTNSTTAFRDNGLDYYNCIGATGTKSGVVIMSKKDRYSYVAGNLSDYLCWELLYDSYLDKKILAVGVSFSEDSSRRAIQTETVMKKISELKQKYGEDITVILGVSGNACASDSTFDIIEETMNECASCAKISADNDTGSRKNSSVKEPQDIIYVSSDVNVYLHKIIEYKNESALPVIADVEIN